MAEIRKKLLVGSMSALLALGGVACAEDEPADTDTEVETDTDTEMEEEMDAES